MKKFRAVIIGCGAIAGVHAACLDELKQAELVAVCDIKAERAERLAAQYGCRCYTDWRDMLRQEQPDSVHICLPHDLHAPVSIEAMRCGAHVITEKPMAISVSEAQAELAAAQAYDRRFAVVFQNRYNPASRLIHTCVSDGTLGAVRGARCSVCWSRSDAYYRDSDWRGTLAHEGGGVVVNQAIHTLDLMLWFLGEMPVSVCASVATRAHDIEVEDSAEGVFTMRNGVRASFWFMNYYACDAPVRVELVCENGTASLTGDKARLELSDGRVLTEAALASEHTAASNVAKPYWGTGHIRQLSDYYHYLETGEPMLVTAQMAYDTHRAMCALLAAGREGREVLL